MWLGSLASFGGVYFRQPLVTHYIITEVHLSNTLSHCHYSKPLGQQSIICGHDLCVTNINDAPVA